MLCYVTPKEHLGLPKEDDVKQGCIAYKIAAHAADVALGIPGTRDRDDELTKARAALNWEKHFELSFDPDTARAYHDEDLDVDTDFCAMCGHDWCTVRISKEIQEFASGKDEDFQPARRATPSPGVSDAGREMLRQRAGATVPVIDGKHACHSDHVPDAQRARIVQESLARKRPEAPGSRVAGSLCDKSMRAHPGFPWLDAADPDGVRAYLERRGWLSPGETVSGCERAGEGNMNLTLRLRTDRRSLVVKQARPWVERYDHIAAPWERGESERWFYERVAAIPEVAGHMPPPARGGRRRARAATGGPGGGARSHPGVRGRVARAGRDRAARARAAGPARRNRR